MKQKILQLIKFFIGWPLSVIALFFLFKLISPKISIVSQSISNINPFLLAVGITSLLIYFFLRALFFQRLLLSKGHSLSLKETSYIWGLSEFKRFVPGNIWAFVGRLHKFGEKGISKKTVISSTIIEAQFTVSSTLIISLLSLNFIAYGLLSGFPFKVLLIFAALILTCGSVVVSLWKNQKINILLLVIMTLSFFFFGLGTYLTISSISYLYLPDILTLIGFFTFSFVAGYISFVTPMGIGVREAVMTAGLSRFLYSVPLAAVVSLFARIILIIAELIFLALVIIWHNSKNILVKRIEEFTGRNKYEILLFISIAIYICYFTIATFLRYSNFFTGRFDLGNMDQTVWNSAHGRIFQLTNPDGTNIVSRLSVHADFILVLLAPFYLLWQDPRMLLFIQTAVIAFGALFVYLLGKDVLKNKTLSLILAFSFLLSPALEFSNLFDFHAVTLATTFLLGAFYFMHHKKYLIMLILLLLAALTKEQVWLVCSLFGLFIFFFHKRRILGSAIFALFACAFYYIFFKAIPQAHGGTHFALSYYSDFGTSAKSVVANIFLSPQKTIRTIFAGNRPLFLFQLFFPLAFLPFLSPLYLIGAMPDFAIDLLSNNAQLHEIYYQYTSVIFPFIFISSIYGAKRTIYKFPFLSANVLSVIILSCTIFAAYFYGPLPGAKLANIDMFTKQLPYANDVDLFLQDIPTRYSITATNNVGSHLSHRQKIFTIPNGVGEADVVVFLLNDPFAQPSLEKQKEMAKKLVYDPTYTELFSEGDFIAFAKKSLNFHKKLKKTRSFLPFFQQLFGS